MTALLATYCGFLAKACRPALRRTSLLAFSLVAASAAVAQPAGVVRRPIVCAELPERGPEPQRIGLARALAAAERYELDIDALSFTLAWAEREANPVHIPILKEIVEAYRCGVGNAALALLAIGAAGEPADYFLGYVADARRDDALASYAIAALEARDDRAAVPALERLIQSLPGNGMERGPRGFAVRVALGNFYSAISTDAMLRAGSFLTYIDEMALSVAGDVTNGRIQDGHVQDGHVVLGESDPWGYASAGSGRERRMLWAFARSHPTAVRAAILRAAERTAAFASSEQRRPTAEVTVFRTAAVDLATKTAFPTTAPPIPAARPDAPVALTACLGDLPEYLRSSGARAAEFTYATTAATPFHIPYGAANALRDAAGVALNGPQPEVFAPNAERRFRTFRVELPAGGAVSWTLAGQSATVDARTARCPE